MRPLVRRIFVVVAAVAGCAGGSAMTSATDTDATTTSLSTANTSAMSTDGMSSTNTTATSTATSTATATSTSTTSTTVAETTGCTFVCPDVFAACPTPEDIQCDIWGWGDEDCCEGEKCVAWTRGTGSYVSTRCTPIDPDPGDVGEPCTVEGLSGIDSCAKGAMCWDVDPWTYTGVCYPLCDGTLRSCTQDPASCCPPGSSCRIAAGGALTLCLPNCDPLLQNCEGKGEACYPVPESFQCAPDQSGDAGVPGDPCESINTCDPGNYCGNPLDYPGCDPNAIGCCVPFCDLSDPKCVPGTVCLPWYDPMDPPFDLGACVIPP